MGAVGLGSNAIKGLLVDALENVVHPWVPALCNDFTSDQAAEEYKWLGSSPVMREWIGGRDAKGLRENGFTIKNKSFEATLYVLVDEIRRDKTGQVMARIAQLAQRAQSHDAKLLSALIVAGESAVCYDGQYFFDADHVEADSGSQSNDLTYNVTTTTAPTASEMESAILKATEAIFKFKDDQGEPMNEEAKSFLVMVPPNFLAAAAGALGAGIISDANGARNNLVNALSVLGGMKYELAINPRLTNNDRFYLFRTDAAIMPFIRQTELGLQIDAQAEGSAEEFANNRHLYGVKKVGNVGYGVWQGAVLTTLT